MTGYEKSGLQRPADRGRWRAPSNASVALTLLAALAIAGFAMIRGSGLDLAGTSAASGQASPAATDAAPSPLPTTQPSFVLTGVFPGPDATMDPKAPPVIPGLRIEAVGGAAELEGLTCESDAGSYPEANAGFTLSCEGHDPAAHGKVALTAIYWTLDGISELHVNVWSDTPDAVVSPTFASTLFIRIADLSAGNAASTWLQGKLGTAACRSGCASTYGAVQVHLTVGVNGGQQLDIAGYSG